MASAGAGSAWETNPPSLGAPKTSEGSSGSLPEILGSNPKHPPPYLLRQKASETFRSILAFAAPTASRTLGSWRTFEGRLGVGMDGGLRTSGTPKIDLPIRRIPLQKGGHPFMRADTGARLAVLDVAGELHGDLASCDGDLSCGSFHSLCVS